MLYRRLVNDVIKFSSFYILAIFFWPQACAAFLHVLHDEIKVALSSVVKLAFKHGKYVLILLFLMNHLVLLRVLGQVLDFSMKILLLNR